jgi:hypothetical protein
MFEALEGRRLLSVSLLQGGYGGGGGGATIPFNQAPALVQQGLDKLATAANLTAPTTTQTVYLGNSQGIESYSVVISGTGTTTKLTVDQKGASVTTPVQSSSTLGTVNNAAVTAEITAIAAALGLTAPTAATAVDVSTPTSGPATYTVRLDSASTTTTTYSHGESISVDTSGNPVGHESLPLSVFSAAVQAALVAKAPAGASALTPTSLISVDTVDGVTLYSATYTASGVQTIVTVNTTGATNSLPTSTQTTFADTTISQAAKDELQKLATADGAGTIAGTQVVTKSTEANGVVTYTVTLTATGTNTDGSTYTFPITITVDSDGNPTVISRGGPGGCGPGRPGGPGFGDRHGGHGGSNGSTTGSTGSTGTTTTGTTGTTTTGTTTTTTPASRRRR